MNVTPEMMGELEALIYWYTDLDGTGLNIPQLVENHLDALKQLHEAYTEILMLQMDIEELHSK